MSRKRTPENPAAEPEADKIISFFLRITRKVIRQVPDRISDPGTRHSGVPPALLPLMTLAFLACRTVPLSSIPGCCRRLKKVARPRFLPQFALSAALSVNSHPCALRDQAPMVVGQPAGRC